MLLWNLAEKSGQRVFEGIRFSPTGDLHKAQDNARHLDRSSHGLPYVLSQIRLEEGFGAALGPGEGFGREITTAGGAFHGGGPGGLGVVAGKEQTGNICRLRGAECVDAGPGRERRTPFFDDDATEQSGMPRGRQELADFCVESPGQGCLVGVDQSAGGADDSVELPAVGVFAEEPLERRADQRDVGQVGHDGPVVETDAPR